MSSDKFIDQLVKLNAHSVNFNWLASDLGTRERSIIEGMQAGLSLDEAIDQAVSPQISKYIYFHFEGEENELTEILRSNSGRAKLIAVPDDFYPLKGSEAVLIRNDRVIGGFISRSSGPGVSFEMPVSSTLH